MKIRSFVSAGLMLAALTPVWAQNGKPDAEGFLRDWIVLAPYSIGDASGADEIDKKQFPEEGNPSPKDGARQKVGNTEVGWRKIATKDFFIDFRELYPEQPERVIAWAVAYVTVAEEKKGLTLRMNSNDQGKAYVNGDPVVTFSDTRTLEKDQENSAENVTLKKGVNVIVLKVINEENNWQGSLRFLDKAGKPVTDLKVDTAKP